LGGAGEKAVGGEEGPGAEVGGRGGARKDEWFWFQRRQFFADEGGAADMVGRVGAPVALQGAQGGGSGANGGNVDFAGCEPGVLRPGGGGRRVGREGEVAVPVGDGDAAAGQLLGERDGEAVGGEVGGPDQGLGPVANAALAASRSQPAMSRKPPVGAVGPRRKPPRSCA
jgi:hypothetical protein